MYGFVWQVVQVICKHCHNFMIVENEAREIIGHSSFISCRNSCIRRLKLKMHLEYKDCEVRIKNNDIVVKILTRKSKCFKLNSRERELLVLSYFNYIFVFSRYFYDC